MSAKVKIVVVVLVLCSLVDLYSAETEPKMSFSTNPEKLRENIRRVLNTTGPLEKVQSIMTQNGFKCSVNTNALFDDFTPSASSRFIRHTNVSYLDATITRRSITGLHVTQYVIGLPYNEKGNVTNVWVQVWEKGLLR
jgi:hypothetical protein